VVITQVTDAIEASGYVSIPGSSHADTAVQTEPVCSHELTLSRLTIRSAYTSTSRPVSKKHSAIDYPVTCSVQSAWLSSKCTPSKLSPRDGPRPPNLPLQGSLLYFQPNIEQPVFHRGRCSIDNGRALATILPIVISGTHARVTRSMGPSTSFGMGFLPAVLFVLAATVLRAPGSITLWEVVWRRSRALHGGESVR
jgi:hypothetical protein